MFSVTTALVPQRLQILEQGASIPPFACNVGFQPCLYSAQIDEGSSLQPEHSRLEVTGKRLNPNLVIRARAYFLLVLRAHKLPRLKTLLGKERRFYVTATDGTTARKTTAIQSIEQAVEWNEKLDDL